MALVVYSDDSDLEDNEQESENKTFVETSINLSSNRQLELKYSSSHDEKTTELQNFSGINSIEDEDYDNITLNDNHVEGSNKISLSIPSPQQLAISKSLGIEDEEDIVNDVPTANTWQLNKDSNEPLLDVLESVKSKKDKMTKLQFILPSLSELDGGDTDDENEDFVKPKKLRKPSSSGTGLFDLLPKPKVATSLVPQVVAARRKLNHVEISKLKCPIVQKSNVDEEETNDYFSLFHSQEIPTLETEEFKVDPLRFQEISHDEQSAVSAPQVIENTESEEKLKKDDLPSQIDQEAFARLSGRRNKGEIVNLIDVNADDALMSRQEWMTRSLAEEKPTRGFSTRKIGMPSHQQKRKHQITYLAHQAREREQELMNSWEQNRFTRMQTQSKYGF